MASDEVGLEAAAVTSVASDGVLASLGEPTVHPWVADHGVQEPRDDADYAFAAMAWGLLLGLQGLDG